MVTPPQLGGHRGAAVRRVGGGRPDRGLRALGSDLARYDGKTFRVVHSVDGDTLGIDEPDGWHRTTTIRFWGVDTPETVKPHTPVQHFGPEASAFTKKLTLGKDVRLGLVPGATRDKYHRLLAYIYLPDGRMLNRLLIEEGYGFSNPRYPHPYRDEFNDAMATAKRQAKGLWADEKPSDLPYYFQPKAPVR